MRKGETFETTEGPLITLRALEPKTLGEARRNESRAKQADKLSHNFGPLRMRRHSLGKVF